MTLRKHLTMRLWRFFPLCQPKTSRISMKRSKAGIEINIFSTHTHLSIQFLFNVKVFLSFAKSSTLKQRELCGQSPNGFQLKKELLSSLKSLSLFKMMNVEKNCSGNYNDFSRQFWKTDYTSFGKLEVSRIVEARKISLVHGFKVDWVHGRSFSCKCSLQHPSSNFFFERMHLFVTFPSFLFPRSSWTVFWASSSAIGWQFLHLCERSLFFCEDTTSSPTVISENRHLWHGVPRKISYA